MGGIAAANDRRSGEAVPLGDAHSESVDRDGSAGEAGSAQRVGNDQSGGEVAAADGTPSAGANLGHATLAGGVDHAGSENSPTRAEEDRQVDAVESPDLKLKVVVIAGGGNGGSFEPDGADAPALTVEVSGRRGDDPGFDSSSPSESDTDTWASIDGRVCSRSPRSRDRKAFDSCDSASSECDAQDNPGGLAEPAEPVQPEQPAEPGNGDSCGEMTSTVQATAATFDQINLGRPGRRHASTRSLSSSLLGACFGADMGVGIDGMGGSGTSAELTQPRSMSLPGSFLVARDGGHGEIRSRASRADTATPLSQLAERDTPLAKDDGVAGGSSSDERSNGQVEDGVWSSDSFVAAKANAQGKRGGDDKSGFQAMANFLPLDKASSAVKPPRARRQPRGNKDQNIISYFMDDSSQSSAGTRSPGG